MSKSSPSTPAPPLGLHRPLSSGIYQEQYEETGWQANVNWKKFHPFACKTALNEI